MASAATRAQLTASMVLVHGGMAQNVGPVLEMVTEPRDMAPLERTLRLADEVVRHKLIRLPDAEAARRGLLEAS